MSNLQDNLQEIMLEKIEKIKPENIKKDVTIFDVVGTLDGVSTFDIDIPSNIEYPYETEYKIILPEGNYTDYLVFSQQANLDNASFSASNIITENDESYISVNVNIWGSELIDNMDVKLFILNGQGQYALKPIHLTFIEPEYITVRCNLNTTLGYDSKFRDIIGNIQDVLTISDGISNIPYTVEPIYDEWSGDMFEFQAYKNSTYTLTFDITNNSQTFTFNTNEYYEKNDYSPYYSITVEPGTEIADDTVPAAQISVADFGWKSQNDESWVTDCVGTDMNINLFGTATLAPDNSYIDLGENGAIQLSRIPNNDENSYYEIFMKLDEINSGDNILVNGDVVKSTGLSVNDNYELSYAYRGYTSALRSDTKDPNILKNPAVIMMNKPTEYDSGSSTSYTILIYINGNTSNAISTSVPDNFKNGKFAINYDGYSIQGLKGKIYGIIYYTKSPGSMTHERHYQEFIESFN